MSDTLSPIDQLNAMPFMTQAQYLAASGEAELRPQMVIRYFDPVACGINGVLANQSDPMQILAFGAFSRRLDMRGCTRFTVTLTIKMREKEHDIPSTFEVRMRSYPPADAGAVAPRSGLQGTDEWELCGSVVFQRSYPFGTFPLPIGVTIYKSASCSFSLGLQANDGMIQTGQTGSVDLWLRGNGITGPTYNALIYGSVWAQS